MAQPPLAIDARGLSKRYELGGIGPARLWRALGRRWPRLAPGARPETVLPDGTRTAEDHFWALRDVGFQVPAGQIVGVIGHNGSGKSTLLKILTRITTPTAGQALLRGRVASLLEVGTGFHPELTGRENIFLNGAILGMTRREVAARFDAIVDFAELARFVDTPVKRYSSGMYVRLAFAVAAHLEPEILLVDEVLAVGDADFQRKCLDRMDGVARSGRTILFVSHNMAAVRRLCERVVVLRAGRVAFDGPVDEGVGAYLGHDPSEAALLCGAQLARHLVRGVDREITLECLEIAVLGADGAPRRAFSSTEPVLVRVRFRVLARTPGANVVVLLADEGGETLLRAERLDDPGAAQTLDPGDYECVMTLPPHLFAERRFHLTVNLQRFTVQHDVYRRVLSFDVHFAGHSITGSTDQSRRGAPLRPLLPWSTTPLAPGGHGAAGERA
nr:polysaccharide ABC transporter ATP-binding protein [Desulfocurvus vexinensis]